MSLSDCEAFFRSLNARRRTVSDERRMVSFVETLADSKKTKKLNAAMLVRLKNYVGKSTRNATMLFSVINDRFPFSVKTGVACVTRDTAVHRRQQTPRILSFQRLHWDNSFVLFIFLFIFFVSPARSAAAIRISHAMFFSAKPIAVVSLTRIECHCLFRLSALCSSDSKDSSAGTFATQLFLQSISLKRKSEKFSI